ncbi:amidase signature domain-containing protein [Hygrophoropsis aurantiaca]|uniref:Amidase signature domain-containing protein n=1 Tax=Hygrophoropsis aurantiaca TaxID=72124 RepID=A0ACB8ACY5_9AGAM|nr:amidase signature domain-containing protein [Hygrophoropsis aurantiaca]
MIFSYFAHRRDCDAKQTERKSRIANLNPKYDDPLTSSDTSVLSLPVSSLVAAVNTHALDPANILTAYGKQALIAHRQTNCLTEIMIADAEQRLQSRSHSHSRGPLAGMPISLKDEIGVQGFDATLGYSAFVGHPTPRDSSIVTLLRDAGAIPFVKTNVPTTLLSYECGNDVFGTTTHPYNDAYTCGGSTGGEAALIACGGSRVGVGSDVAGSVRVPAHWCGVYALKASSGRFCVSGGRASAPGQEGVPVVHSPLAKTLEDLEYFFKAVLSMEPWRYDHSVLPIPWRNVDIPADKPLKWGVLWDDGIVRPSPACERALRMVTSALEQAGHTVITLNPPSISEGYTIGAGLLMGDMGTSVSAPLRTSERLDPGIRGALHTAWLPRWVKSLFAWYTRHILADPVCASIISNSHTISVAEYWAVIAQRNNYRARWHDMWLGDGLDFVLSVPHPLPAMPHGGMKAGFNVIGYAFLWNVLDYPAGIIPVTRVDRVKDSLFARSDLDRACTDSQREFTPRNGLEAGIYGLYDADSMHGLPVGIQIVGQRLEEEKVFEGMKIVEALLNGGGS